MRHSLVNKLLNIAVLIFIWNQITACYDIHKSDSKLREWILDNQQQLMSDTDSIFQDNQKGSKMDSNWISFEIVNTIYADNSLGRLAKISGDSDKCIVTTVKFYKDPNRKLEIMIGALDSTCIRILQEKKLDTDSTDRFVFGKLPNALY